MGKQINYDINFNVNKKNLEELSKSLDTIIVKSNEFAKTTSKDSGWADPYRDAADAAQELKNILSDSWNAKINQLDLSNVKNQIIKSYGSLKDFKEALMAMGPEGASACNQLSSAILGMQTPIKQTSKLVEKMSVTMSNTIRFGISSAIFNKISNSLSDSYSYIKKLDKSLNDIRIVSNESAENMEKFAKQANTAAKSLGTSTLDYTNAALIYYQQGLSGEDVTERTNATLKLANTTGEAASSVSDYMTAIWNNFDDGSKTIEYYADVLAKLGAETASSSDEIAAGLEKFASVAETVGLSYEYATSALTTITATTRQSADTVGTALKTLFSRIQDLELGETLDDGTTLGSYSEALKKVGIDIKDQNGELKEMDDILDEMGAKWKTLNSAQQVALAQSVAGTRQYNQLMALMNNWEEMENNISRTTSAEGTLNSQQETYMESIEAHLETLGASWERLYEDLSDTGFINLLIDTIEKAVSSVDSVIQGLGGGLNSLIYIIATLSNLLSGKLAEALNRVTQNTNSATEATRNLALQEEFLKTFTGIDTLRITKDTIQAYIKEQDLIMQMAKYKGQLTKEQQEELNLIQDGVSYYKDQIDILDQIIKKHRDVNSELFTEQERKSPKEGGLSKSEKEERIEKWEEDHSNRSINEGNIKDLRNRMAKNSNNITKNKALIADFGISQTMGVEYELNNIPKWEEEYESRFNELYKNLSNNINQLSKTKEKLYNGRSFDQLSETEKTAANAIHTQNVKLKEQLRAVKQLQNQKGSLANIDKEEIVGALQSENDWMNKNNTLYSKMAMFLEKNKKISKEELETLIRQHNTQAELLKQEEAALILNQQREKAYQHIIQIASTAVSTISSLSGLIQTWTNPETSTWDKIKQTFSVMTTQAIQLFATFKDWKSMVIDVAQYAVNKANAKAKKEEAAANLEVAVTEEIKNNAQGKGTAITKLNSWAAIKAAAANGTLGTSNLTLAGTFEALTVAALPYIAAIAAIAAAGALVYEVIKTNNNKQEEQINRTTEAIKTAQEAYEETNNTYTELKDNINDFQDMKTGLSNLTKGTQEWKEEILKINSAVLELLDTYPELLKYVTMTNEGYLDISEEGLNAAVEQKFEELRQKQIELAGAQRNKINAQSYYDTREQKENNSSFRDTELSINEVQEFAKALSDNIEIINNGSDTEIVNAFEAYGIDIKEIAEQQDATTKSYISELKENSSEILSFNTAMEGYTTQMDSYTQAIVEAIGGKYQSYEDSENKDAVDRVLEDKYDENYQNILEEVNGWDFDEIASVYASYFGEENDNVYRSRADKWGWTNGFGNGQFYMGGTLSSAKENGGIDIETAKEKIAEYEASNNPSYSVDDIVKEVDEYVKRINEYGYTNLQGEHEIYSEDIKMSDVATQINNGKDIGELYTEDELYKLLESFDAYKKYNITDSDAEKKFEQVFGLTSEKLLETLLNANNKASDENFESENSHDNRVKDNQKEAFKKSAYEAAEAAEYDEEAFYNYTQQLIKNSNALKENDEKAIEAAKAHFKLAKNLETLNEDVNDNESVLREWAAGAEMTVDEMKIVGQVVDDVKTILGDDIDNNFVLENLENIIKLSQGDISVLDDLQKAMAQDYVLDQFHVANVEDLPKEVQSLVNSINNMDLEKIEIGTKLDDDFANVIQGLLDTLTITQEDANKILEGIGYDPEITEEKVRVDSIDEESGTFTYTDADGKTHTAKTTSTVSVGGQVTIPVLNKKKTTYQGSNKNNFTYKPTTKDSSSSSSKSKNTSDDKADRYQEVNNQLAETSAELKKIQSQTDKLTGADLVKNLNSQIENLNKNLDLTEKKLKIAEQEQQEYANQLASTYGIQFNADGSINQSSYEKIFASEQAKYTSAYSDDEAAKTRWEDFKNAISEYNSLDTTIQGLIQDKIDTANAVIEKQIAAFRVSFDISLDLTEARQQWVEFKKNVIDELAEEDLLGTLESYGESLETYFRGDGTGAIQQDTKRLQSLMEIYDKFQAGDKNTIYGDDEQSLLDDIEEAQSQLQDDLTDWESMLDEIQGMYLKGLEQAADAFSDAVEDMSAITQIIDHQIKLMEYALGSKAYKEQNKAYNDKVKAIQSQIDLQTKENTFWKNQLTSAEERLSKIKDTNSEEYYSVLAEYEKAKEEYENSTNELLSSYEDQMDALTSAYVANIESVFQMLNQGLTGVASLDAAQEEWDLLNKESEEYLDTINAIYGVQSLANKYTESINEQSVTAQQKLSKIMESELETLRAKDKLSQYDLDRADLRYQIALKQIALEEAQQNKSTLRLRRDSQGNYTYQYTQDEDEITKLQNELSDLYNQLYNLDTDKYSGNLEKVYELTAEYQDKYKEILQDASLADEERQQKVLELTETYGDLINSLTEQNEDIKANLRESAMAELFDLYGKDEDNYNLLTEAQKSILDQFLNEEVDLTNSAYNTIFGIYDENVEKTKNMTTEQINNLMTSLVPEWTSAYQNIVDNLNAEGGFKETMLAIQDDLEAAAQDYFETIRKGYAEADSVAEDHQTLIEGIVDDYDDLIDTYEQLMEDIANNQEKLDSFVNTWKKAADESEKLLKNTNDTIEAMKTLKLVEAAEEEEKTQNNVETKTETKTDTNSNSNTNSGTANNSSKAEGVAAAIWINGSDSSGWGKGQTRYKRLSEKGVSAAQDYLNSASNGNLYNKWKGKNLKPYYYGAFDTGGYTGEWGSEGKLAMLHQKELVLNAEDTKNILASVAMLRNMTSSNLSQIGANVGISGNGFEQNVHIDATFPNVTNSNEIEEAFNNLVNIAAQRANR